ncbi:MAG: hypothetical protein GX275_03570, partial [Clostridiales bacterium]|nr:hypothetical protein [Clostridiales bacterium]
MKKIISRLLVILMVFSLSFGSIGVTKPKAVEEENKGQALQVLGPNDEFDTTNTHDNFLDYNEMYGPLSAAGSEQQNATKKITESEINPVVVLIDFPSSESDSTKGKLKVNSIYPSSTVTAINSAFSGTTKSLKDYVSKVSGGKCIINPYFSYNINNNTYVYTAEHPKEYYMPYDSSSNPTGYKNFSEQIERTQLLIDAFAAIKSYIPSDMDLDANDDGYIDAVDFFVPYQTDWNTFLWPHKWSVKVDTERKTEVNGAILSTYNLITASYFNGSKYHVITHEFMHTLGFPDMYIYYSGTFSDPIGNWTMMSGNTGYPTVRERTRYGGWISESNIPTISKNGTYTVKGSTLDSTKNTIAYKVTVPNSDEFFMIEYRDQSANTYEAEVPATGLIVYRVNPNRTGNSGGDPEVYVLRNSGQGSYNAYLDGSNNHKSLDLVLSSGESTGYKVEYVSNTSGEAKFKLINNNPYINSFISSNGISLSVGDTTRFTINAASGEGQLKYSIDVNGKSILKDSTNYQADWTPNEAGTYTITAKVVDSNNNVATATKTITVKERNETTIYYKGYNNPYIHYKIGNGSWTNAPGVKMIDSSDVDGYDYKITIPLNGATTLTACFNNGNGSWDSRNGQNYTFNEGYYTYSNGVIKKIPRPETKINIVSFTSDPESETTVSRFVTLSGNVSDQKGSVSYTFEAKDSSGNITKISENSLSSTAKWQPQKAGKYTLIMTVKDDSGNTDRSEKEFTVNDTIKLNNVTFNKTSPIYVGEELSATVSFNGGTGKKKCLSIKAQGGNYR